MLATLRGFDIFGHKFSFFMNGKTITKTFTGFLFTLMATGVITSCFIIFYRVMLDRSLPTIEISETIEEQSPQIRLVDDIFFFISFVNYRTIIPTSFIPIFNRLSISYVYEEVRKDPFPTFNTNIIRTIRTDVSLTPCNKTTSWQNNKGYVKQLNQKIVEISGMCIKEKPPSDPLVIESFSGEKITRKSIEINILPCNLTSGCLPFSLKKDLLIFLGIIDDGYNGLDFEKPLIKVLSFINRITISEGIHKLVEFRLERFASETLTGLLSRSKDVQHGFRFEDKQRIDEELHYGGTDESLATVTFTVSQRRTVYTRSYSNFVDFFADIGGIVQVVVSLFAVVYSIYNRYVHQRDLIIHGIMDVMTVQDREEEANNPMSPMGKKPRDGLSFEASSTVNFQRIQKKKNSKMGVISTYSSFWRSLFRSNRIHRNKRSTDVKDLTYYKQVEYWNNCQRMLLYTTDVKNILLVINELKILRHVIFTDYHLKLDTKVAIYFLKLNRYNHATEENLQPDEAVKILKEYTRYKNDESEGISVVDEIRIILSDALIRDRERYLERESSNVIIFSGIQELLNNQNFMKINFFGANMMNMRKEKIEVGEEGQLKERNHVHHRIDDKEEEKMENDKQDPDQNDGRVFLKAQHYSKANPSEKNKFERFEFSDISKKTPLTVLKRPKMIKPSGGIFQSPMMNSRMNSRLNLLKDKRHVLKNVKIPSKQKALKQSLGTINEVDLESNEK